MYQFFCLFFLLLLLFSQIELNKNRTNAAGYMIMTQYYFLSWGTSANKSDLILGRYTQREGMKPRFDNNKNFYMPMRVAIGGVDTHVIRAAKGYKM